MSDESNQDEGVQVSIQPVVTQQQGIGGAISSILGVVVAILVFVCFATGGPAKQVVNDSIKEYNIASRSGSSMDACVHAGIVAAAYLQAKDETNYRSWKSREEGDCRRAGLR
jgi:hypothetical protein